MPRTTRLNKRIVRMQFVGRNGKEVTVTRGHHAINPVTVGVQYGSDSYVDSVIELHVYVDGRFEVEGRVAGQSSGQIQYHGRLLP